MLFGPGHKETDGVDKPRLVILICDRSRGTQCMIPNPKLPAPGPTQNSQRSRCLDGLSAKDAEQEEITLFFCHPDPRSS